MTESVPVLLVLAAGRRCAIPLGDVVETMRPLPVEPVCSPVAWVHGLSVIRGSPLPVVDLGALLDRNETKTAPGRFVTLRVGTRKVCLAVQKVLGVGHLESSSVETLPPLLQDASSEVVGNLGRLDGGFLAVLSGTKLLADQDWQALEKALKTTSQ